MTRLAIPTAVLSLAACTPQQVATGTQYTEQIAAVCAQASAVLPMFPQLAPWLFACRSATGIARLAMDPSSLTWLVGILSRL